MLMKNNFQSKAVPRGTRTIWRYLSALFILFTFAIGNVWAEDVTVDLALAKNTDPSPSIGAIIGTNYNKSNFDGTGYKIGSDNNSIGWDISASGKTFTAVTFNGYINTTNTSKNWGFKFSTDGGTTWGSELTQSNDGTKSYHAISVTVAIPSGANAIQIIRKAGTSTYVSSITLTLASSIAAPAITAPTTDQSATYTVGDVITPLSVTATGSPTPTYQWYSNASASTTGATLITGAESASYTPSSAAASDLYFYCVATNSEGSAQSPYFHVEVNAAVATAPSFTSPASEPAVAEYFVGDVISALEVVAAGYPAPTLQWYSNDSKSTEGATLITGAESASYTPSNAAVSDLYFYCVATNASGTAQSEYFHVTVAPVSYCAELYPATSGASPTVANQEIILQTEAPNASFGGKIYTHSAKSGDFAASFTYTANGIQLNKGGDDKMRVELTHLMQVGTKITVTLVNPDASKARGFKLCNASGTAKATWQETTTDPYQKTYTVVAGDGLAGSNIFILQRAESSALKELKVSNCGAELLDLSSAVDPVGEATVTLSNNLLVAGGSATATYTISNPLAYDFDEWEITSGDATIADAHAATAAITMGTTASVITLKLKAASTKHTVTYYDENDNNLGEELVVEGQHPVGLSIAPRKLGYTFAGWGTSKAGPVVAFSDVTVNDDMPLYTIWNEIDCSAQSGTIYSMSITVPPAQNCTIKTASGFESTLDLFPYGGIVGGEAMLSNTGSSNNCILQSDGKIVLKDNVSCLKLDFDCPLKEGDKIRSNISGNTAWVSADATRPSGTSTALAVLASNAAGEFVIPAASDLIGLQTIYIWKGGGNTTITSINIYRPAHFAVTFNMHDHGDAVDPQSVVEGGKVTKPTDPTASGWDFGGWFKESTFDNEWDFDNDVVNAATELHALWTVHTTSTDASLSDLQVNGVTVPEFAPTKLVYNVELPMGTTVVPTVVATPTDANAVATVDPCTLTGATITVVPESGVGDKQVYTINFSIATSKDIELVWDKSKQRCDATTPAAVVKSDDATVSTYINKMTFTGGGEGSSLNVGNTAGNMVTLTAKPGYAISAMSFYGKIEADDAKLEYSLNGGAWTDLASTNAGDACYADVFTAAEVHELRMRSAGNKGFWIRNMQLTIIEACTPIVVAWDEEPVEFEVGKAGYAIAATANNSGTITYGSTDASIVAVDAGNGVLSVAALGSVSLSASTAEGDGTTYCENGGNDIVISKVVNTYYLVKFDGQNGEAADEVKFYAGDVEVALPASDPLFAGHTFAGWFDAATGGNAVTAAFTPAASMTLYAHWTTDCTAPTIVEHPESANYFTGRTADALECQATAAGGNALTYTWYSCDDELRTNPVELSGVPTPSTAAAGTSYFFCAVTEEGCANVANSNVAVITVTDKDPICLAWVDVTGQNAASLDASKSLFAPSVSASGIKNSSTYAEKTGWKFNSAPGYIAIEGAPFKSGDIVEMFVTTTTDDKARVFNANEAIAANVVAEGAANMVQGANRVALTADANNLYLRRGDDFGGWNPYVAYVAVYRACAPILNKVTVAGVEGAPDNTNHVAIEVPFSTADAALDAIAYDWISNDAAWTAAHEPAVANAWEWGVENTVTLTDKDNDQSVYYVTISKAAASSDATLSALTVNGQAIALTDGVFNYSFELPYGTSAAPTVVATPNHVAAVATVDPCTLSGATITVVPESGAGDQQVYTLTFVISKWQEVVIWDGSYMTDVATSPGALGMAWEITGFGSVTNYTTTCADKSYAKVLPSGGSAGSSRSFVLNVPSGYVAKFYVVMASHSAGSERGMFIGSNLVKNPDATSVLELSTSSRDEAVAGTSEIVGAGTWYINPNNSIDFQEIRAYLRPGYGRTAMLGNGVLGTVCVDHNVAVEDIQGVTVYELVGREPQYGKVAFDEIVSGELEAGAPYVFQAHGDRMVLFFGDTKVDDPVDKGNGMYGTFSAITLTELDDVYYFAQRALWSCVDLSSLSVPANRAYVMLSEIDYISDPNPAPGRRRILMGVNGETQAQGFENLDASEKPLKVMIDGTLYIIRGEKVFDATGRLVK